MQAALLGAICLVLMANVYVSFVVARSSIYEFHQKLLQVAIVWIIPIVGVLLVWSIFRGASPPRATTDLTTRDDSPIGLGDSVNPDMGDATDVGPFGHGSQ